jgi:hypothetical protein
MLDSHLAPYDKQNGKQNLKPKKKEPEAENEPKKKKKKETKESSPKYDAPAEESAVEPMKGFICYAAQNAQVQGLPPCITHI